MSSKAAKLRNKKRRASPAQGPGKRALNIRQVEARQDNKPTSERKSHGVWITGKADQPDVDLAEDMVGRLHQAGDIDARQLEAARRFQELREGYLGELGCAGFKSCLAGGFGAHDSGDGNIEVKRAYESLEKRLGNLAKGILVFELDKGADERPRNLWQLCAALDIMAEVG